MKEQNIALTPEQESLILDNIKKKLTDRMYNFLIDNNIDLDYLALNIFCQTNMLVEYFEKNIKKTYHNLYLELIDKLKEKARRIQFYSENQIERLYFQNILLIEIL